MKNFIDGKLEGLPMVRYSKGATSAGMALVLLLFLFVAVLTGRAWGGGGGSGGVKRNAFGPAAGSGGGGGGVYAMKDDFSAGVPAMVTVGAGGIRGESSPIDLYAGAGKLSRIVCGADTITVNDEL